MSIGEDFGSLGHVETIGPQGALVSQETIGPNDLAFQPALHSKLEYPANVEEIENPELEHASVGDDFLADPAFGHKGVPQITPPHSDMMSTMDLRQDPMNQHVPHPSAFYDSASPSVPMNAPNFPAPIPNDSLTAGFNPPFVVDLPFVRRTMDGVNRILGVDLGGTEVGETALMLKPNSDLRNDEEDNREGGNSKAEVSHVRLISDACGYITTSVARAVLEAARESYIHQKENDLPPMPPQAPIRKKRGGILGFKELATRSNLSPWHFHRVFRFVTGVTPKAYGEALWEFLMIESGFNLDNEELTINKAPEVAKNNNNLAPSSASSSQSHSPAQSSAATKDTSKSPVSSPDDTLKVEGETLELARARSGRRPSPVDDAKAKQQSYAPLTGPVAPGRVSKSGSRSRGARSRSRNRSHSQSQVFNAFKSETGAVENKQPVRRGRSYSRVTQRPAMLKEEQLMGGPRTPVTASDMTTFSPQTPINGMATGTPMTNIPGPMTGMPMNGMPGMNGMSQLDMPEDAIVDGFLPNYQFDVPDMNSLTLYPSSGNEPMPSMPPPMSGDTGVKMPDSIATGDGMYQAPHLNQMQYRNEYSNEYQGSTAEDPFDFSALHTNYNPQEAYIANSQVPLSRVSPSRVSPHENLNPQNVDPQNLTPQNLTPQNLTPQSLTPQNITTQNMASQNFTPQSVNPQSLNPMRPRGHQRTKSDQLVSHVPNHQIGKHHRTQTAVDPVSFNNFKLSHMQNVRPSPPPSAGPENALAHSEPTSDKTSDFLSDTLNWEAESQQPSFYSNLDDTNPSDISGLPSALIGDEDPPLLPTWNDEGTNAYTMY